MTNIVNLNHYIKKSNELVHFPNVDIISTNKTPLTLNEQKIILIAISLIKKDDTQFKKYSIPYKELDKLMNLGHANYTYLEQTTRSLNNKGLEINVLKNNNKIKKTFTHWFSSITYDEGMVEFMFPEALAPYLLELQGSFTQYQLGMVMSINSGHALKLYEILKEKKYKHKFITTIEDLKADLGINIDSYPRFYDFKKIVLLPAQKELEEKTDIVFTFSKANKEHKVTHLEFEIKKNKKWKDTDPEEIEDIGDNPDNPATSESNIKDIFGEYGIIPSMKQESELNKVGESLNLSLSDWQRIAIWLNDKQKQGKIEKPIPYFLSDPESIIKNDIFKKKEKIKNTTDYEMYVPPDVLAQLAAAMEKDS